MTKVEREKKTWKGFIRTESLEKLHTPVENRTHDPASSSWDALTTELLEALG